MDRKRRTNWIWRALHEIVPQPPVLLAAASTIDVSINTLAEARISEVLPWPLASTELAAALVRCLRTSPGYNRNTITDS